MTNIAVVVLDTLRKDSFDDHFGWLPGIKFENAWSPSHWTVPVHGTIFTGKYASELGVYARAPTLDCAEPVLAEELAKEGYTTRAFSSNPNISGAFDFDRGFDIFEGNWRVRQFNDDNLFNWQKFDEETDLTGGRKYLQGIYNCVLDDANTLSSIWNGIELKLAQWELGEQRSDDGAQEALSMIRNTQFGENEFLFVNLMEAHSPYTPPAEYRTTESHDGFLGIEETIVESNLDSEIIRSAYEDCVKYLSDIYQEMFELLKEDFDYIITLSDHGELFGEHGAWRHDYGIYPELTHVPLSIYTGEDTFETVDEPVGLIDLYDTVCSLAEISDDESRNLLEQQEWRPLLTEYHGITHQMKLDKLRDLGYENEVEEYDKPRHGVVLQGGDYGYEDIDRFVTPYQTDTNRYREAIEEIRTDLATVQNEEDSNLGEDVKAQLEDLGYV